MEEVRPGHDQPGMTRRRFLTDCLFAGGALVAAATLARPEPFFEQVLEGQPTAILPAAPPAMQTRRYPSDHDADLTTCAYPSDSDSDHREVTASVNDFDAPPGIKAGPESGQAPFFSQFSG